MRNDHDTLTTTTHDWKRVHEELLRLATARAGLDHDEGRWLLVAFRVRVWEHVGFGSFTEYIERLFGYAPRFVLERLRVAQALENLPLLAEALSGGRLPWSAVRELVRVAAPDTEEVWLGAADGKTVREIERLVAGLEPGALPGAPPSPALLRRVLRFEVTGETWALFCDALAQVQRDAGEPIDLDAQLLLVARRVLEG